MEVKGKLTSAELDHSYEIQSEIMEHVATIHRLEAELRLLNTMDISDETGAFDTIPTQSLWKNLELLERCPSSHGENLLPVSEYPCDAVLDLLVKKLLHTPKPPLQMLGCSILSEGMSVRFCISGEVDGNKLLQKREYNPLLCHRRLCLL